MAASVREQASLVNKLADEATSYEFFQLVRLARRFIDPTAEKLSFKVRPDVAFPASALVKLVPTAAQKLELFVAFMSLVGQAGIMPDHYTQLLLERMQVNDYAMVDFLDLFNNRLLDLFYQSGMLSHFYAAYEKNEEHIIPALLGVLTGQVSAGQTDKLRYYSGLLCQQARGKEGLQSLLQDLFQLPVMVQQYSPVWLRLAANEISCLSGDAGQLGRNVILGKRVWHVQNRFTVLVGPLNYQQFLRLLPEGDMLSAFNSVLKGYVGIEFDYEIKLLLSKDAVPNCCLTRDKTARLGWATYLKAGKDSRPYRSVKISASKLGVN